MAVLLETSLGDIVVDLHTKRCPKNTLSFVKLCKIKYYNNVIFHKVQKDFMAQTGDPSGTGKGGSSIHRAISGKEEDRYIADELHPKLKHKYGTVSMASAGKDLNASQFFFTLAKHKDLEHLDKRYTVFGHIAEGHDVLEKINAAHLNREGRPLQNIRIRHTIVLDDPYDDPPGLVEPDKSPIPTTDQHDIDFLADTEDLDAVDDRPEEEIRADMERLDASANAGVLAILGDLPHQDVEPEANVLFVCKLNPVTTSEDLEMIFSQCGNVITCEVICDPKTGNSLQYAFIEFETDEQCNNAYLKMNNILIDEHRIRVDWSQSVSKLWRRFNKGDRSMLMKSSADYRAQSDMEKFISRGANGGGGGGKGGDRDRKGGGSGSGMGRNQLGSGLQFERTGQLQADSVPRRPREAPAKRKNESNGRNAGRDGGERERDGESGNKRRRYDASVFGGTRDRGEQRNGSREKGRHSQGRSRERESHPRGKSPQRGGQRNRSPPRGGRRDRSPMGRGGRGGSPARGGRRDRSPWRGGRNRSPPRGGRRSRSPFRGGRNRSPPRRGRDRSPFRGGRRSRSPMRGGRRERRSPERPSARDRDRRRPRHDSGSPSPPRDLSTSPPPRAAKHRPHDDSASRSPSPPAGKTDCRDTTSLSLSPPPSSPPAARRRDRHESRSRSRSRRRHDSRSASPPPVSAKKSSKEGTVHKKEKSRRDKKEKKHKKKKRREREREASP